MRICLYSAIPDEILFKRVGFYRDDLKALASKGEEVFATNSIWRVLRFRPHLFVGYFYSYSCLAAFVAKVVGGRVVLTGGADQISPDLAEGWKLFARRVAAFCCLLVSDRILLSCREDYLNFRKLCFGFSSLIKKIDLSKHVVEVPSSTRNRKPRSSGAFRAVTVCWMGNESNCRRKGVDRAIKLIAKLRSIGVDATLDVAGTEGAGALFLKNFARELGIEAHVHFLGVISEDEKYRIFSTADAYVQLSTHEGFGVAAAEGFFSGMLVVHSNRGGLKDVIGSRGMIVDIETLDEWSENDTKQFYREFLEFEIDRDYLILTLPKYSVQARAQAFFRE